MTDLTLLVRSLTLNWVAAVQCSLTLVWRRDFLLASPMIYEMAETSIWRAVIATLCILSAFPAKVAVAAFQLEPCSDKRECTTSWGKLFDLFGSLLPSKPVFDGKLPASSRIARRESSLWEFLSVSCSWTSSLPHRRNPSAEFCFNYI